MHSQKYRKIPGNAQGNYKYGAASRLTRSTSESTEYYFFSNRLRIFQYDKSFDFYFLHESFFQFGDRITEFEIGFSTRVSISIFYLPLTQLHPLRAIDHAE